MKRSGRRRMRKRRAGLRANGYGALQIPPHTLYPSNKRKKWLTNCEQEGAGPAAGPASGANANERAGGGGGGPPAGPGPGPATGAGGEGANCNNAQGPGQQGPPAGAGAGVGDRKSVV